MFVKLGLLKKAATVVVAYNEKEIFSQTFFSGAHPAFKIDLPPESGKMQIHLVSGEEKTLVKESDHILDDVKGAQMLVEEAANRRRNRKFEAARSKLRRAGPLLERLAPDSEDMANTYMEMALTYMLQPQKRPDKNAREAQEGMGWYQKSVDVIDRMHAAGQPREEVLTISARLLGRVTGSLMFGREGTTHVHDHNCRH